MNRTTTLSALIAGAVLTLAAPAMADDIRLSVTGKDSATLQAEIAAAAAKVCRQASFSSYLGFTRQGCIEDTIKDAQAQLTAIVGSAVPKNTLASR